jgi:DNA invertase Pin-like site-specific DNA recombinase
MLVVLGGLADVERDLIRTRTAEGRNRAKLQGKEMVRPLSLTPAQLDAVPLAVKFSSTAANKTDRPAHPLRQAKSTPRPASSFPPTASIS